MKALPNKMITLPDGVEQSFSYGIGGLIINFGLIELSLIRMAEVVSLSNEKRIEAISRLLSGRISLVKKLLDTSNLSIETKGRIGQTLEDVSKLKELRNTVAHNPIIIGTDKEGKQIGGIMDSRRVKGDGPFSCPLLFLDEVINGAFTARTLGRRLQEHIQEIYDERQNQPT